MCPLFKNTDLFFIFLFTMSKITCQVFHINIYYSKLNRFVFRNFINYQVKSKLSSSSYFCCSMCFWYRTFPLQYVFLIQNVSPTVHVSDTERFCYSTCLWYITFLLQYVFLVQNVSPTVCVSDTERFCCSMCL